METDWQAELLLVSVCAPVMKGLWCTQQSRGIKGPARGWQGEHGEHRATGGAALLATYNRQSRPRRSSRGRGEVGGLVQKGTAKGRREGTE